MALGWDTIWVCDNAPIPSGLYLTNEFTGVGKRYIYRRGKFVGKTPPIPPGLCKIRLRSLYNEHVVVFHNGKMLSAKDYDLGSLKELRN